MTEAAETKLVDQAINQAKQDLNADIGLVVHVEDVQYSLEPDQTGDPAVIVTVVLRDDTRDEDWKSENLNPISEMLRKRIAEKQIDRLVYVRFTDRSHLNASSTENE